MTAHQEQITIAIAAFAFLFGFICGRLAYEPKGLWLDLSDVHEPPKPKESWQDMRCNVGNHLGGDGDGQCDNCGEEL